MIGLSDDDEERWRALTRGFKDALSFSTPAREIAVKLRARAISREASAVDVPDSSGPVTMDLVARQVQWRGEEVDLSPILFDLLAYLVFRPRKRVSVQELLEEVWHKGMGAPQQGSQSHRSIA